MTTTPRAMTPRRRPRSRAGALLLLPALLLPAARPAPARAEEGLLAGTTLRVQQRRSGVQRLRLGAKDAGVAAAMPCETDAEIVVQAIGAGLAVQRLRLEAAGWGPINRRRPERGCRYRKGEVAAKMRVAAGKSLALFAAAPDLVPLAADPRPVRIEVQHGDLRQCLEFGGTGTYARGKKLVAKKAGTATHCPSDAVGHELFDTTGGVGNWIVWLTLDLTPAEFDAITPPPGWIRNQSRSGGVGADGRFLRSPGRDADGEFTWQERFGVSWLHAATVVGLGGPLDPDGLLRATTVEKHHQLTWRAGGEITVLTAPGGERYALVSRDARRTSDAPTIPAGWTLAAIPLARDVTIRLPLRTTVIRADNEDSFQGPLPADLVL